ncbi:hypothetical protein ACFQ1Q_03125 [Winogradskyella litorisediminis]|uniref:TonB C-terminal domain-containing protein n=1 Tax=Winogradskyella litorisediminis TaxID=1156618 RepID=A0ABW3N6Z4_9FLAO
MRELDSLSNIEDVKMPILAKSIKFPVYRGCHKIEDDHEAKKCSIKKIKDFILLSYNYDVADRALPLETSTQFELIFKVNKKGNIEDVTANANHKAIAIEAIRTAKRIPKFKRAGMLNGSPINTPMRLTMKIYF